MYLSSSSSSSSSSSLLQKVDAVLHASLSIFRSVRLKKAFEVRLMIFPGDMLSLLLSLSLSPPPPPPPQTLQIILAFGNYMNSTRRGIAFGFKLESLEKVCNKYSNDEMPIIKNTYKNQKLWNNNHFSSSYLQSKVCSAAYSVTIIQTHTMRSLIVHVPIYVVAI